MLTTGEVVPQRPKKKYIYMLHSQLIPIIFRIKTKLNIVEQYDKNWEIVLILPK